MRKHRITIVDDEPNIGLSLRLILEGEGYGVTICGSAAEFQAQRSPGRADLYLFDVRLVRGRVEPVKERELIRAMGPTVRPDLGKQAA